MRRLVPIFRDVEELEASLGVTSRLQAALDGWARKETIYDGARLVEERYFDAAGRPVKPRT